MIPRRHPRPVEIQFLFRVGRHTWTCWARNLQWMRASGHRLVAVRFVDPRWAR